MITACLIFTLALASGPKLVSSQSPQVGSVRDSVSVPTELKILLGTSSDATSKKIPLVILLSNESAIEPVTFLDRDFRHWKVEVIFVDKNGKRIWSENDRMVDQSPWGATVRPKEFTLDPFRVFGYREVYEFPKPLTIAYASARVTIEVNRPNQNPRIVRLVSEKVKVWPRPR
ncbi:hypothetical protein MCEMSE15_02490 [Fimbriimonadaceae bacterium]